MATTSGGAVPEAGLQRHQTEEEKRREHLAGLTADSEVRAPGMRQRIKEEVQAVVQSIYDRLCLPRKRKSEA